MLQNTTEEAIARNYGQLTSAWGYRRLAEQWPRIKEGIPEATLRHLEIRCPQPPDGCFPGQPIDEWDLHPWVFSLSEYTNLTTLKLELEHADVDVTTREMRNLLSDMHSLEVLVFRVGGDSLQEGYSRIVYDLTRLRELRLRSAPQPEADDLDLSKLPRGLTALALPVLGTISSSICDLTNLVELDISSTEFSQRCSLPEGAEISLKKLRSLVLGVPVVNEVVAIDTSPVAKYGAVLVGAFEGLQELTLETILYESDPSWMDLKNLAVIDILDLGSLYDEHVIASLVAMPKLEIARVYCEQPRLVEYLDDLYDQRHRKRFKYVVLGSKPQWARFGKYKCVQISF